MVGGAIDEAQRIVIPGPIQPVPLPPQIAEAAAGGSRPVRVQVTGANPRVVQRGARKVAFLLIQTAAAAATAYLVDTSTDGDPDATNKRKMPASAPANDMGGWMATSRDLAPAMSDGVAVQCADPTAEIFVGIID